MGNLRSPLCLLIFTLLRHDYYTTISKNYFSKFSVPRSCYLLQANNNRFAVVICTRHVAKRPSKRSALVIVILEENKYNTISGVATGGQGGALAPPSYCELTFLSGL